MTRSTRAQWTKRIEQWQRSGLDAASFAALEGVKPEQLRWWRWHPGKGPGARRRPTQPHFVEVVLPGEAELRTAVQEAAALELLIGNRRVLVRPGFDARSLRQVLAVLALPLPRSLCGPGLLADTLVRRWQDHLLLHRLERIYGREGLELARSTVGDWHAPA